MAEISYLVQLEDKRRNDTTLDRQICGFTQNLSEFEFCIGINL